jgi:hypothetical protein
MSNHRSTHANILCSPLSQLRRPHWLVAYGAAAALMVATSSPLAQAAPPLQSTDAADVKPASPPLSPCSAHGPDGSCEVATVAVQPNAASRAGIATSAVRGATPFETAVAVLTEALAVANDARGPAEPRLRWLTPEPPAVRKEWYGWQVLVADASWMVLAPVVGVAGKSVTMGTMTGLGGFCLAGPLVHAARGNGKAVLESVALRVGLPIGGALSYPIYGAFSGGPKEAEDFYGAAAFGAGLGVVTAIVADVAFIANETVTIDVPPRTARNAPGFAIVPTVNVARQQQTIGVQGTF